VFEISPGYISWYSKMPLLSYFL